MITIIRKSIISKEIFRYFFIFVSLFTVLFTILNVYSTINEEVLFNQNQIVYRTIKVKFNDDDIIDKLSNDSSIIDIINEEDIYIVTLREYSDVEKFCDKYNDYIEDILINYYEENNVITILNNVLKIVIYILSFIIFALLVVNIIEVIKSQNSYISLYKIIGYKNKVIFMYYLLVFLIVYSLLYLIGLFFSLLTSSFMCIIFNSYQIKVIIFSSKNTLNFYLLIVFVLIIISTMLYRKIKKITPIDFLQKDI